jgi:hypothetical protein
MEMIPTHLIHQGAGLPDVENLGDIDSTCVVCGCEISEGVPIKKVVSDAFTNWDVLADATKTHVCKACTWCIKNRKTRQSCYVATDDNLVFFKRDDIEKYMFDPPETPFVLFVTASYKKHGSFRAHVNQSRKLFYVQFEDRSILFSPSKYRDLFDLMKRMYATFNKTEEIGKGEYIQHRVQEYGIDAWKRDESIIAQHRGSMVFELLLYALNKPEETLKKIEETRDNVNRVRKTGRRAARRRA